MATKKTPAKKSAVKKTPAKKTPAKKAAVKKAPAKKAETKVETPTITKPAEKKHSLATYILVGILALGAGGALGWYVVAPALIGDGVVSEAPAVEAPAEVK